MAQEIDPFKLSSPRIFLVRMVVFLTVCALVVVVFYKGIWSAFLANPVVNALIIGVLVFGIALAFQRVIRLFPEIEWVTDSGSPTPGWRSNVRRFCSRRWRRCCVTASAAWRYRRR